DTAPRGICIDITGPLASPPRPVPQITLLGGRPESPLLAAIAAAHQTRKASLRGRRVSAEVGPVADGSAVALVAGAVSDTLICRVPPTLDAGLLDVTIASDAGNHAQPEPATFWTCGSPGGPPPATCGCAMTGHCWHE
ncbi:hypothetical protein G3I24_28400, partial [Micromonospora aurantiaca]|nr:hypothetical protein [Micromonospora aurantiaca]